MDFDVVLKLVGVLFLVLLNGFFVAAEFALVKIRETQLDPLIRKGSRPAKAAKHILANLDSYLSAAQLGITLASLALGWIGEPAFKALLEPILSWMNVSPEWQHTLSVIVGFSAITFLHIVAGEQAPKWFAIQKPLPTTLWSAYPMLWFHRISFPFIWLLNHSAQWLLRRFGMGPADEHHGAHSEEELRLLVAGTQRDHSSTFGRTVVLNALDLRQRVVREVMRPRKEIVVFDTDAGINECLDVAEKTRFSRIPLCEEGDLDRTLGVVHFKDLYAMRMKIKRASELAPVARKLVYVPETARLEKVLQLFLERKLHFGMVVDEYGGTVGMITLENILEEIVGQIQDEFDQEIPLVTIVEPGTWDIDGALPLHDLAEMTGEAITDERVSTSSGWVTQQRGGFPKVGDVIAVGQYDLRVEVMDQMRVSRLRLIKRPLPPSDETETK